MALADIVDRDSFACWVGDFLQGNDSFLDLLEVARIGRIHGILSPVEAADIERANNIPDWLGNRICADLNVEPSNNYRDHIVITGKEQECSAPVRLNGAILPVEFQRIQGRSPDIHLIEGENGIFTIQNFLKAGFLSSGFIPPLTDARGRWSWGIFKNHEPRHLVGRTLICVVEGSAVYTHWLFDTLPRFKIARMIGLDPGAFDHVVVATKHAKFHVEGLAALKIPDGVVHSRGDLGPVIKCDEFCYVSPVRQVFFADEWLYNFVRDVFGAGGNRDVPRNRLYISRSRASRRRVVNEDELLPVLAKYGFRIVHAEELSISETAQICSSASYIVAPHGAGLANLVFVPPGAKVLEVYGAHISPEYWRMSNSIGHTYYALQGVVSGAADVSPEAIERMGFFQRNGLDIRLDPVILERALNVILE